MLTKNEYDTWLQILRDPTTEKGVKLYFPKINSDISVSDTNVKNEVLNANCMCAMGALAKSFVINNPEAHLVNLSSAIHPIEDRLFDSFQKCPHPTAKTLYGEDLYRIITQMNDSGTPLPEIADYIESLNLALAPC